MIKMNRSVHRLLVYTSLYPGIIGATHGIFVKELTDHLTAKLKFVKIVVPVDGRQKLYRQLLYPGNSTTADACNAVYDTFWTIPKFFKGMDGLLMYHWTKRCVYKKFSNLSIIHSHYAYPDSEAARILAGRLKLPYVVTVHGSDINIIARNSSVKNKVVNVLRSADAVVAVSNDLLNKVKKITGRSHRLFHIPNGIDEKKFFPANKEYAKKQLNLSVFKKHLLFVGRLEPVKGIPLILDALSLLPKNIDLIIVGVGSKKNDLEKHVKNMGLVNRVLFAGAVEHNELHHYYQAADALVLASYSEGWPTVILEALACGIPVVSPKVGGVAEVVKNDRLGIITSGNAPELLAKGFEKALCTDWDKSFICRYANQYTWDSIASQYIKIYKDVLSRQ